MEKEKVVLVYAHACNEVYTPITVFKNFDEAKKSLNSLFGIATVCQHLQHNVLKWDIDTYEDEEKMEEKFEQIFTSYYGSCGDVCTIYAMEINFGELPLFPFDLD